MKTLNRTANGNYFSPDDPGEQGYEVVKPRKSVTDEECLILRDLCRDLAVLEIGTGLGVSTRAIASSAKYVASVDVDPWCHDDEFPRNVALLRQIPRAVSAFDLVFIDGSHLYPNVVEDIRKTAPILTVVLHDTYLPAVLKAAEDTGLILVKQYPTVCKLAVYRRK